MSIVIIDQLSTRTTDTLITAPCYFVSTNALSIKVETGAVGKAKSSELSSTLVKLKRMRDFHHEPACRHIASAAAKVGPREI